MAIEAFSGIHDFLNNHLGFGYGPDGLAAQDRSFGARLWGEFMNIVDVPLSSPFALNNLYDGLVAPEMRYWLQAYYENLRKDRP